MGVDYYSCHGCGDTFPDCGEYFSCDGCGNHYCSEECGERQIDDGDDEGDDTPESTCKYCRNEAVTTDDILAFLCKKYKISIAEATKQCLEDAKNGK
jgi:hypothetical protein